VSSLPACKSELLWQYLKQRSHASLKLLESLVFFIENSRIWKVLENHCGPGKCLKLKLGKSWKTILENHAFF